MTPNKIMEVREKDRVVHNVKGCCKVEMDGLAGLGSESGVLTGLTECALCLKQVGLHL